MRSAGDPSDSDAPVPALENRLIVAHDDSYYQTTAVSRSRTGIPNYSVIGVRLVCFTLDYAAIVVGYRRQYRLMDVGNERPDEP